MLISNYGLFWQRKYVHFGYGGNKGTLFGKMSKKKFLVNFREQIGTYVLYDKDFIPIVEIDYSLVGRKSEYDYTGFIVMDTDEDVLLSNNLDSNKRKPKLKLLST